MAGDAWGCKARRAASDSGPPPRLPRESRVVSFCLDPLLQSWGVQKGDHESSDQLNSFLNTNQSLPGFNPVTSVVVCSN